MKSMQKSKGEKNCHEINGHEKSMCDSAGKKSRSDLLYLLHEVEELYNKVSSLIDNVPGHKLYGGKFKSIRKEIEHIKDDQSSQALSSKDIGKRSGQRQILPEQVRYNNLKKFEKKSRYEKIITIVTQSVHRSIDLDEVIENAVDAINKNVETAQNVSIFMVEGTDAVLKAYRGFPNHIPGYMRTNLARIPFPKGFTWKTLIEGVPRHCPDVDQDSDIGSMGRKLGTKSYVSMPISYSGKAVGVININSFKKFAFDKEDLDLLGVVAEQIETAVKNAKQVEELRQSQIALEENLAKLERKNRYENIINTVATSIHQSLELGEVLENAVEVMSKHIEAAEYVSIYMVESKTAVLKAYRGYPEDYMRNLSEIAYPKGSTWRTIMEGEPMYCPDVDKDPYIGPKGKQLGTKSYVSMPIRYSGKAIGCIKVSSNEKYSFDREELSLLEIVAKQIETAINNAKQAQELRRSQKALKVNIAKLTRKNRYQRVISAVTKSIHRSLELDQVFENAVLAMNKEIKEAKKVVVYMVEEKAENGETTPSAVIKASSGYEQRYMDRVRRLPYPIGTTWKTITEGQCRYVSDVDIDDIIGDACKESGVRSYISVPLSIEGSTVGCVHICSPKKNAFRKYDIILVENVAKQLETAINNAKQAQALRKSEEALRKSRDELEERVYERTSELQKANTLLIKEILERRCVESELKQSLTEKDILFKEIHHRVKNNLQIISSLLNLQSRQIKDENALASFNESKSRIRSIATLHEQLYRSKNLSRIDFTAYIRNMTNYLLHTYGVGSDFIRVNMNTERIYLDLNTAIPCGLIVNELVSNAIKHGFPDGAQGEIKIDFKKEDDKYFLSVSNNGVMFPKDLDINNCTTLGLELVSSLSKQLKGKISLTREDVTEFKLEFAA